ncbi:MAG TPA: serine/threonine-protein kinase [Kofleriaceae bacterium]
MPAPLIEIGMRIGAYTVVGTIGRGGMGGVFEVQDAAGTRFALKSPVIDVNPTGEVTRRFAREANALRLLEHPNLVAAHDVFVEAGQLFLVMEHVVGRTLGKALAQGRLEPRQALVFARQILDGVGHAHGRGLVHRDLKPDNILLAPMNGWERVKIIDFGLVKLLGDVAAAFGAAALTRTGLVFGTPAYMAPEQALGRLVDARADLYAIGVILFEMLVGTPPYRDPDPYVMMRLHAKAPIPSIREVTHEAAWCTPELVALVETALRKTPDERFASAEKMIAAVDAAFASLQQI